MKTLAQTLGVGLLGLKCAHNLYNLWQGGNQWSAWDSFITFFRHVVDLKLDYSKYDFWEKAAIHGGPRVMHEEFCMISDRPIVLLVDDQNRPHNENGPFCEWSDGSKLYSIHGVRVPAWVCETPVTQMDAKRIMGLKNAEERLCAIRKFGAGNMLKELNGKSLSKKGDEYELFSVTIEGERNKLLRMQNPSIDHVHWEWVHPDCKTVNEALLWRIGMSLKVFREPVAKT